MKKKFAIISFAVLLGILMTGGAHAGFWDWFDSITGQVTSGEVNLTINVGNTNPVILNITINNSQPLTLTENPTGANHYTAIVFFVTVNDSDGAANLESSATVSANFSNILEPAYSISQTTRSNSSCTRTNQVDTYQYNWTCSVQLAFFDPAGEWNITVQAIDINGGRNVSQAQVVVGSTTGMTVGPVNVTWPQLGALATNRTPDQNITLNNTGNTNFTTINLTAYDLRKVGGTEYIPAENFSISGTTALRCVIAGAAVNRTFNGTGIILDNVSLPKGNYTVGDESTGQEVLYLCLREVPALTSGVYTTAQNDDWFIEVYT